MATGEPMQTLERSSTDPASLGSPVVWHFRALPPDVQRVTIRRLALSGLRHDEIAMRIGLPRETVLRVIAEDECLAPQTFASGSQHALRKRRANLGWQPASGKLR
jgi:hypothetical protein